jgi:RHS repeat-associated protein
MTYSGSNQLEWDKNGRLTNDASRFTNYEYNWDGKLRSVAIGSDTVEFKYDPFGNRISKNSSVNGNHRYIIDLAGDAKVLLVLDAANNNAILTRYVHTDREVLMQQDNTTAEHYFYLHDRLGSIRLIIDDTGSVVNSYTYDPWGKAFESETQETVSNDYRFAGYFWDDETGMYYCNVRYYHPELMRFIARDSAEGDYQRPLSLHKYLYCENEPINRIDPLGLWTEEIHRSFGTFGWGYDSERGFSLFDYARLDIDKSAKYKEYRPLHFKSKYEANLDILGAISEGDVRGFEYGVHEYQDTYTHAGMTWHLRPSIDEMDWNDQKKVIKYRACDRKTKYYEDLFFKFNPEFLTPNQAAQLTRPNASLSIHDSWLSGKQGRAALYMELMYKRKR